MATIERRIVEALLDALRDSQATLDRVYEERGFLIPASDLPAIDVGVVGDDPEVEDVADDSLGHRLAIEVAVLAVESRGSSPSKMADPVLSVAFRAVMRAELGDDVRAVTPGPTRITRQETSDGVVMRRAMTFFVDYVSAADDLDSAP